MLKHTQVTVTKYLNHYLCFHALPLKMKKDTLFHEENVVQMPPSCSQYSSFRVSNMVPKNDNKNATESMVTESNGTRYIFFHLAHFCMWSARSYVILVIRVVSVDNSPSSIILKAVSNHNCPRQQVARNAAVTSATGSPHWPRGSDPGHGSVACPDTGRAPAPLGLQCPEG